jgi:8-oxo-dGTP pyrophosphatase MutT (NUDIX family)
MNKKIKLNLQIEKPFGNLFRKETVLVACKTSKGTFLFGEKKGFYPDGIFRLIGGGVEESDNSLVEAAKAEVKEETGFETKISDLIELGMVDIRATDEEQKKYHHMIHLFFLKIPENEKLKANDDLTNIIELNLEQTKKLVEKYKNIPKNSRGMEGGLEFSWYDYAQVYGPVHQFVLEKIQQIS